MNNLKKGLNYAGNKYKLLPVIKDYFPKQIETYIEPFLGGFNVALNIEANNYILNEYLFELFNLYNILKNTDFSIFIEQVNNYIKKYDLDKQNKEAYLFFKSQYNELNIKQNNFDNAVMFFILISHSFNNFIRFNLKGEFNLPFGNRTCNDKVIKSIYFIQQFLNTKIVSLYNYDFNYFSSKIIDLTKLTNRDFIYLDPPYFGTKAVYNNSWDLKEEIVLIDFIQKLIDKDIPFGLSNSLINNIFSSEPLVNLLNKNENKIKVHKIEHFYNNPVYTKKSEKTTQEIYITNI